jgi:ribosomal protein S18 acetylase RimI-like enzyme
MTCATLWQRKPTHAFAIFRLLVYRLAVLCEYRRRRVGLALVRAGEEHLRRQGAHRITALVGYENGIASAFWEAAGYPQDREIGRREWNEPDARLLPPVQPDEAYIVTL